MREGWEVKPLKEVCLIKPPKSEARKNRNADILVSFAPMEALGIDQKHLRPNQTRTMGDVVGSYTYFSNGDVLLAKITPCFENGKLGIASDLINDIGFGSSEYIVFRANQKLDAEWLYYYLSRQSFRDEGASRMAGAVGHKRTTKDFVEDYPVPLPPLPEQRRIVAILDEAFEGIATAKANAEKNLQNAREVFESHLNAVFSQRGEGWVEKPLIDYSIFVSTGPFGSLLHKSDYGNTGIPLVNPINISGGFITPNNEKHVSKETAARLTNYILESGDVVVARRGDIGRCAKIGDRESGWLCGTGCFFVRPKPNLDGDFLAHLIRSNPYREKLEVAASGATMLNLSNTSLSALRVAIPNIEIQRTILSQLNDFSEETQHLESLYQQKLTALNELKQSLLHQAFNGDL